jgi:tRNA G10  N-methylase Trm11
MYGFLLGREFKLSVAEILSVFPNIETIYQDKQLLLGDNISEKEILEKASRLGGTIKIIALSTTDKSVEELIYERAPEPGNKYQYALSTFGIKKPLKEVLMKVKKGLKADSISARFINKDFKNVSSAQIIGELLIRRQTDFNYIVTDAATYFGQSIWVQDIYAYSKRDYAKDRDMQVGMLPPKLSQMMINLSNGSIIYDPFVGLGTILIESLHMGNKTVFGSDLSEVMVETSTSNCKDSASKLEIEATIWIEKLNAKYIYESDFFNQAKIDAIVTEGYLWEVMTKKNISKERILKQRESLIKIHEAFFAGLKKINYTGNIVICFPFWEHKGIYSYFDEIYDVIAQNCEILPLFPTDYETQATKAGSLLYKREKQLVWREIFKLKIK